MKEFEPIYVDGKTPRSETVLQILVPKELKRELRVAVAENDTNISKVVRGILENYVKEHKENKDKLNQRAPRKKATKKKKSA